MGGRIELPARTQGRFTAPRPLITECYRDPIYDGLQREFRGFSRGAPRFSRQLWRARAPHDCHVRRPGARHSLIHTETQDGTDHDDAANYLESWSYVDGFGRTIVSLSEADPAAGDEPCIASGLDRLRLVDKGTEESSSGICLKVHKGLLQVAGQTIKDVVLWRDTAPDEELLTCIGDGVGEVRIWNCWRDDRGVTQAWVGNSGMLVEEKGENHFAFRCNSVPEVTFEDLIFKVLSESNGSSNRPPFR